MDVKMMNGEMQDGEMMFGVMMDINMSGEMMIDR